LEQNKQRGEFSPYFQQGILKDEDIYAEIGDIIGGKVPPPPEGGRRVVSLIGVSSLDIVLAKKAYEAAKGASNRSSFRF
jgi:ornithine cyclodeaminase/alanine dehydrogenase-like protein (mu-crystallin family)